VQEQAKARGANRLTLEVESRNERALTLYRKHDFKEGGQRVMNDPVTGRSLSLMHMAKAV